MATRRKSVKDYPRINNCRVSPETFSRLNSLAGEHSLGWAIEQLVAREKLVESILQSQARAAALLSEIPNTRPLRLREPYSNHELKG